MSGLIFYQWKTEGAKQKTHLSTDGKSKDLALGFLFNLCVLIKEGECFLFKLDTLAIVA